MSGTAIFDMDRTLTRKGTWSRYMIRVNRHRITFWMRLPFMALHAVLYKLKLFSRRSVKEHGLSTLKWATREHLEQMAQMFAEDEVANGLRLQTKSILASHRQAGDRLVMATAAADLVAIPIAKALGFDVIIATDLEWSEDQKLTGRLAVENCYGAEKLVRIVKQDAAETFARPITAYSDHGSDEPMLMWADTGIAVNPSKGLQQISERNGLTIVDWDSAAVSASQTEADGSK